MNKKVVTSSVILLTATLGLIAASISHTEKLFISHADTQMIDDSNFISVDNFAFSGKGISMEFSIDQPTVKLSNTFTFMHNWDRLTKMFTMTFNTDGSVNSTIGKVYKFGDNYVYQLMLEDLKTYEHAIICYSKALEFAGFDGSERIVDAYSGVGTIGIIASDSVKEVISVEQNREAVNDAKKNAKLNSVENIKFVCADATEFLLEMASENKKIDPNINNHQKTKSEN